MGNIAKMLLGNMQKPEGAEREALIAEYHGYHQLERQEDGSLVEWDPKEKAKYTPKPERFHGCDEWDEVVERYANRKFIIIGAGESALELQDLHLLNGQLVYGINWTWDWFMPTFLQSMDAAPIQKGIIEASRGDLARREVSTCLVANTKHEDKVAGKWGGSTLWFGTQEEWGLQETPGEPVLHTANSLGVALSIAYWFRPERIVLVGFDFGGAHFFGDGRTKGCIGHYGEPGSAHKQDLWPKLRYLRDALYERKIPVAQVGETALDVFPGAMDLEHAIKGEKEDFLWP